jgi:hypothetical protein
MADLRFKRSVVKDEEQVAEVRYGKPTRPNDSFAC